jgi:DNA helicase-2/ATP-dependent DNA helicase PcrA
VYVPLRYYHRPAGGDDVHGYGKASRFLTDAVQALFAVSHAPDAPPPPAAPGAVRRELEVSVDGLFV